MPCSSAASTRSTISSTTPAEPCERRKSPRKTSEKDGTKDEGQRTKDETSSSANARPSPLFLRPSYLLLRPSYLLLRPSSPRPRRPLPSKHLCINLDQRSRMNLVLGGAAE